MMKTFKFKRLTLYITEVQGKLYSQCTPIMPQTCLDTNNPREAEQRARRLLREALKEHIDIIH